MIDYVLDNIKTDSCNNVKDSNKDIGERVKKYTLINNYFDNYLRVNKKIIAFDFMKYILIFSFIITYILNYIYIANITMKANIILTGTEFYKWISYYLVLHYYNLMNNLIGIFEEYANIQVSFLLNIVDINNHKLELELEIDTVIYIVAVFVFIYALLILKQYFSQKNLFNAGFIQYYIPIWATYSYLKRDSNQYIYIKLIPHQKNINMISNYSENALKHIFHLDNLTLEPKDKIDIHITPKALLGIYDYYLLTYTINKVKIKDIQVDVVSEVRERVEEIIENIEDNLEDNLSYLDNEKI